MFVWSPGRSPERIADGVWLVRGGFPSKIMNVYLLEDSGGVTVFDAGIAAMTEAVAAAGADLGGIRRVVLGHADADHRGSAPGLGAPVFCHPQERAAAESPAPFREYWDFAKLRVPVNVVMPKLLKHWDGGAVPIAGVLEEGDEVAGFRVVHLPGHAPGLIGLFRPSDRLALCSDCLYTLDVQTSIPGRARLPHRAFNFDTEQARASILKLAALDPSIVWAGHTGPVRGDVGAQLERAAAP
jgi:glyoxylase-like metal-dependent hydrolase (beta-lactamase superfamily II)